MRPVSQPGKLPGQIPRHPPVQRRPVHPSRAATSTTSAPSRTARTASRRCSTTDKTTSANPGLPSPTPAENVAPEWPKQGHCRRSMAEECRTSVAGGQERRPESVRTFYTVSRRPAGPLAPPTRRPARHSRWRSHAGRSQRRSAGAKTKRSGPPRLAAVHPVELYGRVLAPAPALSAAARTRQGRLRRPYGQTLD